MDSHEQEVRNWSMLCHLSALLGLIIPFTNLLGPFIVWQIKKNEFPEIDLHAKESLNFQITFIFINIVFLFFLFRNVGYSSMIGSSFLMFTWGTGLALLFSLVRVTCWILVVIAGIKANNGELFHYPSIKFIR
jgi:uncharacterized Tic20 family protein